MASLDVSKKRPSQAPWIFGLLTLGLILWGVTGLLAPPDDTLDAAALSPPEAAVQPAAIPAPPVAAPTGPGVTPARSRGALGPLGEEHVGRTVRVRGEVVVTGNDTFWMLAGYDVLRVDSPRRVRKGQAVSVSGTVRSVDSDNVDADRTDRVAAEVIGRLPGSDRWNLVRSVKLVEDPHAGGEERPVAPTRPGA